MILTIRLRTPQYTSFKYLNDGFEDKGKLKVKKIHSLVGNCMSSLHNIIFNSFRILFVL